MNFIMIGLLLREVLDRLCVHFNMYLVDTILKLSTLLYTDVSVVGAPSATNRDLSDIAIDDDFSTLDEFLASSTETAGKLDRYISSIFSPHPVML